MSSIYVYLRIFSFVWLELTKVSQAAAGRNLWIDPSKYPKKYPNYHVRQRELYNYAFMYMYIVVRLV